MIAVKVAHDHTGFSPKDLIKGLEFTARQAKETGRPSVALIGACGPKNDDVDAAVTSAIRAGVFTVVSAGDHSQAASAYSPARASGAFTVAATNLKDECTKFSNFGPAVDIYAPGEGIISTSIGSSPTSTLSGTAQAAAHVAGLAAYFLTTHAESGATPATIGDTIIKLANHRVLHNVPDHTVNLLASNNTGL
ncbi:hypothetical protein GCM10017750_68450 [Streptomyces racemochromogenes]